MDQIHILLVDDDEKIRDMVKEYFSLEDWVVHEACDGVDALEKIKKQKMTVVVLDVMMPKLDGWRVLKTIRETSGIPVILLTARGQEYDKLHGFELGADDYLVKPFSPKELTARIKALLHRTGLNNKEKNVWEMDGFQMDFFSREVIIHQKKINLTPKEYDLLNHFVQNPNKVFSRAQLLDKVWGTDFFGEDRTVDTHVKMLREHMGPYRSWIETVWKMGYKFKPENKT